jgi:hypothetical protein
VTAPDRAAAVAAWRDRDDDDCGICGELILHCQARWAYPEGRAWVFTCYGCGLSEPEAILLSTGPGDER